VKEENEKLTLLIKLSAWYSGRLHVALTKCLRMAKGVLTMDIRWHY